MSISLTSSLQKSIGDLFALSLRLKDQPIDLSSGDKSKQTYVMLNEMRALAVCIIDSIDSTASASSSKPLNELSSGRNRKQKQRRSDSKATEVTQSLSESNSISRNVTDNVPSRAAASNLHRPNDRKPSPPKIASADSNIKADRVIASTLHTHLTASRFSSLAVHPGILRSIREVLKYDCMTLVQEQAVPHILGGLDVLVKAKTGTGKTLAFLVPAIDALIRQRGSSTISTQPVVLILSPTRELAQQISTEATRLCAFHTDIGVVTLVGGTNIEGDRRALFKPAGGVYPSVVVGTPGRLLDHLQNDSKVRDICSGVLVQILDEADRLLDMGFKRDVDSILNSVADAKKGARIPWGTQTLLFSATVDDAIRGIASVSLKRGYRLIDTVGEEEQTHTHVPQSIAVVSLASQLVAVGSLLEEQMNRGAYKMIVFCATARLSQFMAAVFSQAGVQALEMHSRMSQPARTRTAEAFRVGVNLIMFSSDVSARGMDYPDVTFVLQVGLTDKAQYIHRLGRTARGGKGGSGCLIVAPFEENLMRRELGEDIHLLDVFPAPASPLLESRLTAVLGGIQVNAELLDHAKSTTIAWLGFYKTHLRRLSWEKSDLVENALILARSIGLRGIPPIQKKTLGKMGLQGCPGLTVE